MLCKNCKREIEYKESFEKMTDRVLRSAIEKLKKNLDLVFQIIRRNNGRKESKS